MASPLTALATANSGRVESDNATYATAVAGSGLVANTAYYYVGQAPGYYLDILYLEFDTSGIGAGQIISAATFSLYGNDAGSAGPHTEIVAAYDYGVSATTADWRTAAQLTALTALASKACTTAISESAYTDFTSQAAFLAAINPVGMTRLIVFSASQASSTQPSAAERVRWNIRTATGKEPKLVVTYAPAATGCPKMADHYARLRG